MTAPSPFEQHFMTADDRSEPEPLVLEVPVELVARRHAAAPTPPREHPTRQGFLLLRPIPRAV